MTMAEKIVSAARAQVGDRYVADYVSLKYPGGDVPAKTGACTDVVIRSLRAVGVDLQRLVHEDMGANFSAYPKQWGLKRPDRNIDHRRVPNLRVFFTRRGHIAPDRRLLPGDILTFRLSGGLNHIGIVSDRLGPDKTPFLLHNLGPTCTENDAIRAWPITGHYRWKDARVR